MRGFAVYGDFFAVLLVFCPADKLRPTRFQIGARTSVWLRMVSKNRETLKQARLNHPGVERLDGELIG